VLVRITSALVDPALLDLPWNVPLEEWPASHLVALPQGISRHIVRFVKLNDTVYALKETRERIAEKEYDLLRALERIDFPAVEAVAIVNDRQDDNGEPLESVLITRHLQFSLPYRALFSHTLRPETMNRLLDALAALIVRMHLTGFSWGDCSLSNTLFRRDAGAFAAYLVDAETGNLYPKLSEGQRSEDIEILRLNIFGECLDLEAAELLHEAIDPESVVDDIVARYERLWHEVTYEQEVPRDARHDIEGRIRRLNELGFDVAEVDLSTVDGGYRVRPKVVDAGYHTRRLLRLTGLDAEENQARQLLNDLDAYRAESDLIDEQQAAHRWLTEVFEPVVRAVPANLRRKLEPQEIFSQIIQHKWLLSERAGRDVGMGPAVQSYLTDVLAHKPDEQAVLGVEVSAV
jgi:tRNA A-37 threonylcarbamoyl transferase component Bud32